MQQWQERGLSIASPRYKRENPEAACEVLLDRLTQDSDVSRRSFYVRDFATKFAQVRDDAKPYLLSRLLLLMLTPGDRDMLQDIALSEPEEKPHIDIGIVTIRKPELIAAQVALNLDPRGFENDSKGGYDIWRSRVPCDRADSPLSVILTMAGEVREVACAIACQTLHTHFNVDLAVLIGVGAGDPSQRVLGDVVAANTVIDTAGGRIEASGMKVRPNTANVREDLVRFLEDFDPDLVEWYDFLTSQRAKLEAIKRAPDGLGSDWRPGFAVEPIFTGPALHVDSPWEALQQQYHQQGRTFEMEALGFARVCEKFRVPWLIFRGISDFAETKTKDGQAGSQQHKDAWQPYAALSAATAALSFVKNSLRVLGKRRL